MPAEATGLDAAGRRVLARRPLGEQVEFGYDYLILAAGVRQSYFGHDEYAPIAPGMKTIEDAMKIRERTFTIDDVPLVAGQPYGGALGPSVAATPVRSADPRDAGAGNG